MGRFPPLMNKGSQPTSGSAVQDTFAWKRSTHNTWMWKTSRDYVGETQNAAKGGSAVLKGPMHKLIHS